MEPKSAQKKREFSLLSLRDPTWTRPRPKMAPRPHFGCFWYNFWMLLARFWFDFGSVFGQTTQNDAKRCKNMLWCLPLRAGLKTLGGGGASPVGVFDIIYIYIYIFILYIYIFFCKHLLPMERTSSATASDRRFSMKNGRKRKNMKNCFF